MKKSILFILLAFCSMAFAEQEETVPVNYADSAAHYEEMSVRLKVEADSLTTEASNNVGFGIVMTLLGGAGTIWSVSASGSSSLEGGGVAVVMIMVPSVCLLIGGVMGLAGGIGQDVKAQQRIKQSEEYRNTAEKYRAKAQHVELRVVPIVDPFQKTVGGMLALNF